MKRILMPAAGLLILGVAACEERTERRVETTTVGRTDNTLPTGTTTGTTTTTTTTVTKPEWTVDAQRRLQELDTHIEKLGARASEVPAESRAKYDEVVADLRKETAELRADLDRAGNDAKADWNVTKRKFDDEFREMRTDLDQAGETLGANTKEWFRDARTTVGGWMTAAGEKIDPDDNMQKTTGTPGDPSGLNPVTGTPNDPAAPNPAGAPASSPR